MSQPELFEDLERTHPPRGEGLFDLSNRFLSFKVAYEDLIFAGLGLILILLVGFCLGVERGKRLAGQANRTESQFSSIAAAGQGGIESEKPVWTVGKTETLRESPIPVATSGHPHLERAKGIKSKGTYAIQLASYVGLQSAEAERQRLIQKGIPCEVVKRGRYYVVRAIGFSSRDEAEQALASLRKVYRDALIREMGES